MCEKTPQIFNVTAKLLLVQNVLIRNEADKRGAVHLRVTCACKRFHQAGFICVAMKKKDASQVIKNNRVQMEIVQMFDDDVKRFRLGDFVSFSSQNYILRKWCNRHR